MEIFFGVLIGIVAYVMLYIGKGIQKYAIEGLKTEKKIKSKHSGVWIFGTVLTALFVFVQWIPLTVFHTPMNLIAPLEGIGLITLIIFSYFVLKEKISWLELIAIGLIITGTVLINIAVVNPIELQREALNLPAFGIALGITIGITVIAFLFVFRKSELITGIVLALTAGSFMAFQTLTKRITDIDSLALIFTFVMFVFAIATLGFTQYALVKTRANIVVPCFTSASIIVTSLLGIFVIDEFIQTIQIIGIVIIVVGVILMNLSKEDITSETEIDDSSPTEMVLQDEKQKDATI
jgi:drug/metabolite transporter (DMT)-like permease